MEKDSQSIQEITQIHQATFLFNFSSPFFSSVCRVNFIFLLNDLLIQISPDPISLLVINLPLSLKAKTGVSLIHYSRIYQPELAPLVPRFTGVLILDLLWCILLACFLLRKMSPRVKLDFLLEFTPHPKHKAKETQKSKNLGNPMLSLSEDLKLDFQKIQRNTKKQMEIQI